MKKKVDDKNTLKYAVAFIFHNTINVDKDPMGNKEITIL